jgi:hypothetical protein
MKSAELIDCTAIIQAINYLGHYYDLSSPSKKEKGNRERGESTNRVTLQFYNVAAL